MPLREITIDLSAVSETLEVPIGNRINCINVPALSAGASFQLKLGNNLPITISNPGRILVGNTALPSDAQQGVKVINPTAQAGATARLVFSYTARNDKAGAAAAVEIIGN